MSKHTANFLVSHFLSSKRSLKKIYGLRISHISILRYICDSIDINYSKRKQFNTKLYQTQISKFSRNSERTVRDGLNHLIKKRLIAKVEQNKSKYTVGIVLIKAATIAGRIDTGKNCIEDRYRQPLPISNSSNITNTEEIVKNKKKMQSESQAIRKHEELKQQEMQSSKSNGVALAALKQIKSKLKGGGLG